MTDLKVVFVVGKGRSGSTLLDDMLGMLDGVESLGELRQMWRRGLLPDYACSCGKLLNECGLWTAALAGIADNEADFEKMAGLQQSVHSWWRMPVLLAGRRPRKAREFGGLMGVLYRQVAESTGATTLVDSSKWPVHVGMAGMVPGIDPYVLHLVRDPRAVAYSYTRHRGGSGQPIMPRFGAVHSALSWSARNVASGMARRLVGADRFRRLRYEDLVDDPVETLESLADWLGTDVRNGAWVDDHTLHLSASHLVGGNPRRFERGDIEIRRDDAWRSGRPRARRVVGLLTGPLRRRYGYGAGDL